MKNFHASKLQNWKNYINQRYKKLKQNNYSCRKRKQIIQNYNTLPSGRHLISGNAIVSFDYVRSIDKTADHKFNSDFN